MKVKRIITLVIILSVAGVAGFGRADDSPSDEAIAFAQRTSDLMLNDANRDMRLIGNFDPLLGGDNDLPGDAFEQAALGFALQGQTHTSVERVGDRWYYRRSVALSNTFHPSCVMCHTNFTSQFFKKTRNPGQWVGALTLRVPIKED